MPDAFLFYTLLFPFYIMSRTGRCAYEERAMFKNCRQIMAKADKAFMYGIILLKGRKENGDLF